MKLFENLTKWQNYAHYVLLTFGVFGIHHLTDIWGIEAMIQNGFGGWIVLFLFYTIGIFVVDTLIHALFYILPKPYQWRD